MLNSIGLQSGKSRLMLKPYLPAIIVFIGAVSLTTGGFLIARSNYRKTAQIEFDQAAQERVAAIQRSFRDKFLILASMHSMYSVIAGTPGLEFRAFVMPFESELEGLQALQWVARVKDSDRDSFEAKIRYDGFAGYEITEKRKRGIMVRAARRAEYYPIYPIGDLDAGELSTGFDMASDPVRRQALELARDSGNTVATARVRLIQEQEQGLYGFLMFAPVYKGAIPPATIPARRESIRGFIIAVFRFRDIVESALEVLEPKGIDITLSDLSATGKAQWLYTHYSRTRTAANDDDQAGPGFRPVDYSKTFIVGGRSWSITNSPAPHFMESRKQSIEWLILVTGMAFSVLLVIYLVVTTKHAEEMRVSEIALLQARNDLELRVEERTRDLELAQEELIKQGRLATLGQLTATVSHELRNPLATALTSLDLLKQQLGGMEQNKSIDSAVKRLVRAIRRCDRIIDELLDYTRLRIRTRNVIELDKFVVEYLSEHQLDNSVSLSQHLDAAGVRVEVDEELLSRALINIVDNACQAMKENKDEMKINLGTEKTGTQCRIMVRDNGPGMTREIRDKLFEPLYSTKAYGVGLGMAIVKQILEQLGGHVEVKSEPGQGTEISLWLPVINQAEGR